MQITHVNFSFCPERRETCLWMGWSISWSQSFVQL